VAKARTEAEARSRWSRKCWSSLVILIYEEGLMVIGVLMVMVE
jgi:hypothetical protein